MTDAQLLDKLCRTHTPRIVALMNELIGRYPTEPQHALRLKAGALLKLAYRYNGRIACLMVPTKDEAIAEVFEDWSSPPLSGLEAKRAFLECRVKVAATTLRTEGPAACLRILEETHDSLSPKTVEEPKLQEVAR
jgi:hypothetical protein